MVKTKVIKNKDLAHHDHFDFLDELERVSAKGFDFLMARAIREILEKLRRDKLHKSDELKSGWTGSVPQIRINLDKVFEEVMSKYFEALKWILMGDAAGKEATEAAEKVGLKKVVEIPGVVPAAYLNAIDTHRQHFQDVFGKEPPEMNRKLISDSLDLIKKRTDRFADESLTKMQNRLIQSVEDIVSATNFDNLSAVQVEAHALLADGAKPKAAVDKAVQNVLETNIAIPKVSKALRQVVEKQRDDWNLATRVDTGLASAVGTHQALTETFGRVSGKIRVAWYSFGDERRCEFCKTASRKPDGGLKVYDISEFEQAGFNFTRKKSDWVLCVPPAHYNCRCSLIYIPEGFDIDDNGSLIPSEK